MRISYKKRFSLVDSSRPASSFFATKSISLNVQTCGGETIKIENRFLTLRENKSLNKITLLFAANKLQTKFILIIRVKVGGFCWERWKGQKLQISSDAINTASKVRLGGSMQNQGKLR